MSFHLFSLLQLVLVVESAGRPLQQTPSAHSTGASPGPPAQNLKSGFELCTGSNLRQRKSQRIGHGHYGHHAAADFCSNGEGTPMWNAEPPFCCPKAATWCAGCAEPTADKDGCQKCLGGYKLFSGHCTGCMDIPGWTGPNGDNCFGWGENHQCSDVRFHGLSSNMACCTCGGGLHEATPFMYYVQPMVFGDTVVSGWPLPRTAERYSVNADCPLLSLNLTVNGSTGHLELLPSCQKVGCGSGPPRGFQATCTITAHQPGGLNFSAIMQISAAADMAYPSSVLVVTPNTTRSFKPRILGEEDNFSVTCMPDGILPWVHINKTFGVLTVDPNISREVSGVTGVQLPGLEEASGGLCQVSRGTRKDVELLLLAPVMWPAIHYTSADLRITVGESAPPLSAEGDGRVGPTRFSMVCSTKSIFTFEFDELTGFGLLNGYDVLTLDVRTGALALRADANLTRVFDHAPTEGRSSALLQCQVLGHFEWQAGMSVPPIRGDVNISVLDHTCWKKVVTSDTAQWKPVHQLHDVPHAQACRAACRRAPSCGIYTYSTENMSVAACSFWSPCGSPAVAECSNYHLHPWWQAYEKIVGCKESETCLSVDGRADRVWLYEGNFCPAGLSFQHANMLEWAYQKEESTVEDSFYLQAPFGNDRRCPDGSLWLRRANATWDFHNRTTNYLELYGELVACLSGNGELLQDVFDRGTENVTVSENATYIGAGIQLSIESQHCTQPPNLHMADADNPMSDAAADAAQASDHAPVLLDDPSTTTPFDFSLDACECFPMSWGVQSPVQAESFQDVPAGSENQYIPRRIAIVRGSFMCEQKFLGPIAYSVTDEDACEMLCTDSRPDCGFYWFGVLGNLQQCRLYSQCHTLFRAVGASGTLYALPPAKYLCRRANPDACWAISKRREFLHATTGSGEAAGGPCLYPSLIEQCDQKLLLGGEGVEKCFGCLFAEVGAADWQHKRRLPSSFVTGAQLTVACWQQRYTPVTHPEVPGPSPGAPTLSCVGGHWWDDGTSQPALEGFACGACVQVVKPPYSRHQEQQRQELYFSSRLMVVLLVDQQMPVMVNSAGHLVPAPEKRDTRDVASTSGTGTSWQQISLQDPGSGFYLEYRRISAPASFSLLREGDTIFALEPTCLGLRIRYRYEDACLVVGDDGYTVLFEACASAAGLRTAWCLTEVAPSRVTVRRVQDHGDPRRYLKFVDRHHDPAWFMDNESKHLLYDLSPPGTHVNASRPSLDSDAVPLLQFDYTGRKHGAADARASRRSFAAGSKRESKETCLFYQKPWYCPGIPFMAEPLNATSYDTWRLRSLEESTCLTMDAKGVLGSEACAPEELGMLTGSSGPGNLGSLGNLGGSSAHELFSVPILHGALNATMTATHAQYTRQSQSIANSLWEARIVRNCSGNPLQFLRFEGTDAWHGCGITPSKSLGEVKETLIVPSVQVKYGERCLAFSSDTSRLDFRSCELPYTAFVWNGSKLIYSISTRRWCLSLLNSSWPNSGSCTRYGQDPHQLFVWDSESLQLRRGHGGWCLGFCARGGCIDEDRERYYAKAFPCQSAETEGVEVKKMQGKVECPAGSLLTFLFKPPNSGFMNYQCAEMAGMGSCMEWETPKVTNSEEAFQNLTIACQPNMALQSIYVQETGSDNSPSTSFRYRCCYITGLVMGIVPSGFYNRSLETWEGTYCPGIRDISGRLRYVQRSFFGLAGEPSTLAFDYKLGSWCLESPRGRSCVQSSVPMPLDAGNLLGPGWQVVEVSDFNGNFVARGVASQPEASAPKAVRQKPALVSFSTDKPSVPEECKEMVPDWEIAQGLSDENPCKLVSGKKPRGYKDFDRHPEKYGSAAFWGDWHIHDSYDDLDEGSGGAGFSYSNIMGCWSREGKRGRIVSEWLRDSQRGQISRDLVAAVGTGACLLLGDMTFAPGGFGSQVKAGDVCGAGIDIGVQASQVYLVETEVQNSKRQEDRDAADCSGESAAFARIWCDLHCVKSAVQEGDAAILHSLEKAVKVLDTNVDLLTEYYTGLVGDKVDTVLEEVEKLKTTTKSPDAELSELRAGLRQSFDEMRGLTAGLDYAGQAAFQRAIGHFVGAVRDLSPNSSALSFLVDHTDRLHSTLTHAHARHRLSQSGAVAARVTEAAGALQQLTRSRNHLLGVYHHRAAAAKEAQSKLSQGAAQLAHAGHSGVVQTRSLTALLEQYTARQILTDLDHSWWTLRAAFDAYLQVAEEQTDAFRVAATLLHDYTHCKVDFATLREGYAKLQAVQHKAHEALKQTWSTAVPLSGLLVAKIVDNNALAEIARSEARASLSSEGAKLCQAGGLQLASVAVNHSFDEGLAGQTVQQLILVFAEMSMLKDRFESAGLTAKDADVMDQSVQRSLELLQAMGATRVSIAEDLQADADC